MPTAKLALADGSVWTGESFGAAGERAGEVVFHTAMFGYQEILTDPSYCGQIVVMTTPHIGNYGVNEQDVESHRPWVEGFVVREESPIPSNPRSTGSLRDYLARNGIVGISGIDTRALTMRLRTRGSINGVLATDEADDAALIAKAKAVPSMEGQDLAGRVTRAEPSSWRQLLGNDGNGAPPSRFRVALLDFGVKHNIVRSLVAQGCDVTIYPAQTPVERLLAEKPHGVCLSNGPGDPAAVGYGIATARALLERSVPTLGICLGHQIVGLALGARTYKLKFGHHGANHPVRDARTGKVEITSQNHGFSVDADDLVARGGEITHVNLNDGTVEGFRLRNRPVIAVQYHPEAAPGPHDARPRFSEFLALLEGA